MHALLALSLFLAPQTADEGGFRLVPATAEHGEQLTIGDPATSPHYLFECGERDVKIVQFGVTGLMDLTTGKKIEDAPGSQITPGAAFMALFSGSGQPDLIPAEAAPNARKGWNLTIRLAKDDKSLRKLAKANMMSLFTTGYTEAIAIGDAQRKLMGQFVEGCRGAK